MSYIFTATIAAMLALTTVSVVAPRIKTQMQTIACALDHSPLCLHD
jgi:hypothetical protein